MPIQYLKQLLTDAIRRQRSLFVAAERTALCDDFVVDHNLLRRSLEALDVTITPAVRWVTTLSYWDNRKLHAIDHADDGLCRCGLPHTLQHWFWMCPLTQHLRDIFPMFVHLDPALLEGAFGLGIPPELSLHPLAVPWDNGQILDIKKFALLANGFKVKIRRELDHQAAIGFVQQYGGDPNLSARQLVAQHRGSFGTTDLVPIPRDLINDAPPVQVWADGGLSSPALLQWGLGGAGFHAPNVCINVPVEARELHRLASLDSNAVLQDVDAFTSIPGPLCPSTRAATVAYTYLTLPTTYTL